MTTDRKADFAWLYVYEGCERHGCKIGVSRTPQAAVRLAGARRTCQHSTAFAKVWPLLDAYQLEQSFIAVFNSRRVPRQGREWFHMPLKEMLVGIDFIRENILTPVAQRGPRRHRLICGYIYEVDEDGNRLDGGPIHKAA